MFSTNSVPHALRPEPSLEWTASGKALGPRFGQCHHSLRGPSAFPASAPQIKRQASKAHPCSSAARVTAATLPSSWTGSPSRRQSLPGPAPARFASSTVACGLPAPRARSRSKSRIPRTSQHIRSAPRRPSFMSAPTAASCQLSRARSRGMPTQSSASMHSRTSTLHSFNMVACPSTERVKVTALRGASATGSAMSNSAKPRPDPSLEPTRTGMALGPRSGRCHHPLRGPRALPASARSAQT